MTKRMLSVVLVLVICSATAAFAGMIDLSKIGIGSSAPAATTPALSNLAAARDNVTNKYMSVIQSMTGGLQSAASSFGLQNAASGQLSALKGVTASGIDQSSLSSTQGALGSIVALIRQKMQTAPALNAGEQQQYAGAVTGLAGALQKGKELLPLLSTFAGQTQGALKGASLTDAAKISNVAAPGLALVNKFPAELQMGKDALILLVQYAKAKGIAIPAIANGLI